jgi:hypothetical protein
VAITDNATEIAKGIRLDDAEGGDANRILEVMVQRIIKQFLVCKFH